MINKDSVAKVIRKHSSDPEYRKRVQQSGNSGIEIKCRRSDVLRAAATQLKFVFMPGIERRRDRLLMSMAIAYNREQRTSHTDGFIA